MAAIRKKNKLLLRKILVSSVALLLVAGLVFSAVFGFADYFMSGDRGMTPPVPEGDYLSSLEGFAASLEETLAASPDDDELKLQLSEIYLEIAMVHGSQGGVEALDRYALKGEALLQDVLNESPAQADLLLKLALLAAFYQEDDVRAEEYFQSALDLTDDNGEVHLFYGMFLSMRDRDAEAQLHLEKVLELEPEGSYLAEMARLYTEGSGNEDD